ncbi:hypothetical protein [Aurantimonas sp. Leaf443]|uniref:hypothetical protein n=1 Tax=Aurantimonas sp. Leaf443 TaxID=1736378 RepID=UPI0006F5211B|nr:hypothetical protein [Aurantimonas sp. Leaf443]KQT86253.1 hypothetical protein ASG48_06715 [Aurantimonas sp. Leaf443]
MSGTETTTTSHMLALLRRFDLRQSQMLDLILRQQELLGRLERDMREGFDRIDRDVEEVKCDLVLAGNNILNRLSEHYQTTMRLAGLERPPMPRT